MISMRGCVGGFLAGSMLLPVYAADLKIGQDDSTLGSLTMSGFVRAKYRDADYATDDHKIQFDAAKINLDYKSSTNLFGHLEYRCYQYDTLCDFSALVDGYVGYKLNKTDTIKVGLQDVPFGPGRGWENTWYSGLGTALGLEDAHNLGISYHVNPLENTQLDLAYFFRDGGNYTGISRDAARYTANFVKPDNTEDSYLKEKHMIAGRVIQDIPFSDALKTSIGGSYWYSDLENQRNGETGKRHSWALFNKLSYNDLTLTLTGGKNHISNKDTVHPEYSVMGSFDGSYNVANKGTFYTADLIYVFRDVGKIGNIMPYATYSSFIKDDKRFADSTRNIVGVQVDHKSISLVAEYVMGKNDVAVNGDANSLLAGSGNKRYNFLNLLFIYNF